MISFFATDETGKEETLLAKFGMYILSMLALALIMFINTKFKQRYVLKYVDSIIFILPVATLISYCVGSKILTMLLIYVQISDCNSVFLGTDYRMTKLVAINIATVVCVGMNPKTTTDE